MDLLMKLGHEHKSNKEICIFLSKLLNANRVYSVSFAMKSIEYYPTERLLPKGAVWLCVYPSLNTNTNKSLCDLIRKWDVWYWSLNWAGLWWMVSNWFFFLITKWLFVNAFIISMGQRLIGLKHSNTISFFWKQSKLCFLMHLCLHLWSSFFK